MKEKGHEKFSSTSTILTAFMNNFLDKADVQLLLTVVLWREVSICGPPVSCCTETL